MDSEKSGRDPYLPVLERSSLPSRFAGMGRTTREIRSRGLAVFPELPGDQLPADPK